MSSDLRILYSSQINHYWQNPATLINFGFELVPSKTEWSKIRPLSSLGKAEENSHAFVSSLHSRKRQLTLFQEKSNGQSYKIGLVCQALSSAACGSRPEPNACLAIPGTNLVEGRAPVPVILRVNWVASHLLLKWEISLRRSTRSTDVKSLFTTGGAKAPWGSRPAVSPCKGLHGSLLIGWWLWWQSGSRWHMKWNRHCTFPKLIWSKIPNNFYWRALK